MRPLTKLLDAIGGPNTAAATEAQRHLDTLTKPPRSLGRLARFRTSPRTNAESAPVRTSGIVALTRGELSANR